MRSLLAIDPGMTGSMAFFEGGDLVRIVPMPVWEERKYKHVDAAAMMEAFWRSDMVVCEEVNCDPRFGAKGNFGFGRSCEPVFSVLRILQSTPWQKRPADDTGPGFELIRTKDWHHILGLKVEYPPAPKGMTKQEADRFKREKAKVRKQAVKDAVLLRYPKADASFPADLYDAAAIGMAWIKKNGTQ